MGDPSELAAELDAFPAALRALIAAEVRAGNAIAEVGHSHPAPPRGAYVRMARPLATAVPDGLDAYARDSSLWSTEVTVDDRAYWVLGAPGPPPPDVDMDAIRAAATEPTPHRGDPVGVRIDGESHTDGRRIDGESHPNGPPTRASMAWDRFADSLELDHERWHDGVGIDLAALADMGPDDRARAESVLVARRPRTWREVRALAQIGTASAEAALVEALADADLDARLAVVDAAPHLVTPEARDRLLVDGMATAAPYAGLSSLLLHVEQHHPPAIRDALVAQARLREGDAAIHMAALADHLDGAAGSAFDWDHRPFYLRFAAEPGTAEREAAWRELCLRTGRDPGTGSRPAPRADPGPDPGWA